MTTPHVVIIGAGFGGIAVAKSLKSAPVSITIIDRLNHNLFQPLLYQVATGALSPSDIAIPVRKIIKKQKNAQFLMGSVTSIDTQAKSLLLEDSTCITYDWLVVAPGTQQCYFGKDEWKRFAPGLKTVADAAQIQEQILASFEKAERIDQSLENSKEEIQKLLTFVIVGGGPTGVEMAGAVSELAHKSMSHFYKNINTTKSRIILLEGAKHILPAFPESLAIKAEKELQSLGVNVYTNTKVTEINDLGVTTDRHGFIPTQSVVWAAGNQGSPLLKSLGCELDRQGRAVVGKDLSIPNHPQTFVIGDAACSIDASGKPLPGLAPVANQEGYYVASIIKKSLSAADRKPFAYFDKGSMATIGRGKAILSAGKIQLSGLIAWLGWSFIHIAYLTGFTNRLYVFLRWIFLYCGSMRSSLLITKPLDEAKSEKR
ncbi:MAG: NAD(P)/FAD-dependent oxidoreductase [Chlamydia sp.]